MTGCILITGGAGFIGSRVALRLAGAGWKVRVLDVLLEQVHGPEPYESGTVRRLQRSVDFMEGDVRDSDTCRRSLDGCTHLLHLAAETGTGQSVYNTARYVDANVLATATLCDAIADCRPQLRTVVVASSRAIYGEGRGTCLVHGAVDPPARRHADLAAGRFEPRCPMCSAAVDPIATPETAPPSPVSVYGVTKLAQEQLVLGACRALGLQGAALRFQNVYGPGQSLRNPYVGILPLFAGAIASGEPLQLFEDGRQTRDFIHVDDVVGATCRALATPPDEPLAINVGSGTAVNLLTLLRHVEQTMGRQANSRVTGEAREGDIRHNRADLQRARTLLDFAPSVSLRHGIAQFVNWAQGEHDAIAGFAARYGQATQEMRERGLIT